MGLKRLILLTMYFQKHQRSAYKTGTVNVQLQSGILDFEELQFYVRDFLTQIGFYSEYCMYRIKDGDSQDDSQLIDQQWKYQLPQPKEEQIEQTHIIDIMIKSSLTLIKKQIKQLQERCFKLEQQNDQLKLKIRNQQISYKSIPTSQPMIQLKPSLNFMQNQIQAKLDLAFLFSEPLKDQVTGSLHKAVGFQTQIYKIKEVARKGSVPVLKLRYQLATSPNLSNILKNNKPRVLHIICHGSNDGNLIFEHHSKVGILQLINTKTLGKLLQSIDVLPEIVFINACHSEFAGKIFLEKGCKYIISIDSKFQIEDRAAAIFSQQFYVQLFKGEKVAKAFEYAKMRVQKSECNMKQCCCSHNHHDCLWPQIRYKFQSDKRKILLQQQTIAHEVYHANDCACPRKFENKHQLKCSWAVDTMFHINKRFSIVDQQGKKRKPQTKKEVQELGFLFENQYIMVCCCFDPKVQPKKPPHCDGIQSQKFKIFGKEDESEKPFFQVAKTGNMIPTILDQSAINISKHLEKGSLTLKGRQGDLYNVIDQMINIRKQSNFIVIHGKSGCGKSIFVEKLVIYLTQRRQITSSHKIDLLEYSLVQNCPLEKPAFYNWLSQQINQNKFLVLDHCDNLLSNDRQIFLKKLKKLSQQHKKLKILLTHNTPTQLKIEDIYQQHKISPFYKELPELSQRNTISMLYQNIKDKLESKLVFYDQFQKFLLMRIQHLSFLQCPKKLKNFCIELRKNNQISKKQLKNALQKEAKKNVDPQIEQDLHNNKLMQKLKQQSVQAHEFLVFIAQFEAGISFEQLQCLFLQFENRQNQLLTLPFTKKWFQNLKILQTTFEIYKNGDVCSDKQYLQGITLMNENIFSPYTIKLKNSPYFIQNLQNILKIKDRLRIYIWKKYTDPIIYNTKLFCMKIYSTLLQHYFKQLKQTNIFHENAISQDYLSASGIFSKVSTFMELLPRLPPFIKNSVQLQQFSQPYSTATTKELALQKILSKEQFIKTYKSNFENFYQLIFSQIEDQLSKKNELLTKVFRTYCLSLIILIPTFFRYTEVDPSLEKIYVARSIKLLKQFKQKIDSDLYFEYFFKLHRMKIQCYLQEKNFKDFTQRYTTEIIDLLKEIQHLLSQLRAQMQTYEEMNKLIHLQQIHINLYLMEKSKQKTSKTKLQSQVNKYLKQLSQQQNKDTIIFSKIVLLLSDIYLYVIDPSDSMSKILRQNINRKKQKQRADTFLLNYLEASFELFRTNKCWRLYLEAYISYAKLKWLNLSKITIIDRDSPLIQLKKHVSQAFSIYKNINYKLSGQISYERSLKQLNIQINQKFWKEANSRIVFLEACPLISTDYNEKTKNELPVLQNQVRRSYCFRKGMAQILNHSSFQKSEYLMLKNFENSLKKHTTQLRNGEAKFGILTKANLAQQTQQGCSILVIRANTIFFKGNPYLIVQDDCMKEQLILIDEKFIKDFRLDKIDILILIGRQAEQSLQRFSYIMQNPPIRIAFNDLIKPIQIFSSQEIKKYMKKKLDFKKNEIQFIQSFFKELKKRQILNIQCMEQVLSKAISQLQNPPPIKLIKKQISHICLNFTKNQFDIVPNYTIRNHNLDWLQNSHQYVRREYKHIINVLEEICKAKNSKVSMWKCIFGKQCVGKTFFLYQLANILIQRNVYKGGVYYFSGKQINQTFGGNIQEFLQAKFKRQQMPNKDHFLGQSSGQIMIMIDDIHLLSKDENYRNFLKQLDKVKAHVLLTTQQLNKRTQQINLKGILQKSISKEIRIDNILELDIVLYASSIFETWDEDIEKKLQQIKKGPKSVSRLSELAQYKNSMPENKKKCLSFLYVQPKIFQLKQEVIEQDRINNENASKNVQTVSQAKQQKAQLQ